MPITKIPGKKKDGLQAYRVRVNYTDLQGNYKQVERTAYGMAEAKELERQLAAKPPAPTTSESSLTINELFEEYIAFKKNEVRATTLNQSKSVLQRYVLPVLGEVQITELSERHVGKWRTHMNDLNIAVGTRNNVYNDFCAFINYAKKMKYISDNPVSAIGRFKDPNFEMPEEKLQYYTVSQWSLYARALLSNAHNTVSWGAYVFFCIAYYTGMRKGEINALKWSDISGDLINIRRSVAQKIKGVSFLETPPKNKASYRTIQIPVPLHSVLQDQKERQKLHPDWTEDYRVCGGISVLSDTAIDLANRAAAAAAGLPRIRVHDFRHSHATLLINEGINIQEIARRLGHTDVKITWNTYSHLYPRENERAMVILNSVKLPDADENKG